MKAFWGWVIVAGAVAGGAVGYVHQHEMENVRTKTRQTLARYERREVLSDLELAMERYRRQATTFRKLSPGEIDQARAELKGSFQSAQAEMAKYGGSKEIANAAEAVDEMLMKSVKLEPQLYSRDALQKAEVRAVYDEARSILKSLREKDGQAIASDKADQIAEGQQALRLIAACAASIVILLLIAASRESILYVRPIRKLKEYALAQEKALARATGEVVSDSAKRDPSELSVVKSVIDRFASRVEASESERHRFVSDIVSDLKAPLTLLQSGKILLASDGATAGQVEVQAADSVKMGLFLLSGMLEDLGDALEIGRIDSKLSESVTDVSELISSVARRLGSSGGRSVSTQLPPMPAWVVTDPKRMERALVQIISKVSQTVPRNNGVKVTLRQPTDGAHAWGVEIVIQDAEKAKAGRGAAGPEMDVLKHWISDGGISLSVVNRIIRAQGGSVSAAGVAGTSAEVVIRLPRERVVGTGLVTRPRFAEGARVTDLASMRQDPSR